MKNISSRLPSGKQATASTKKVVYRVKTWAVYNQALVQRGTLTVWLSQEAVDGWRYGGAPQRGAQFYYSALAIETALTFGTLFNLPLRQTQGFVQSLLGLMGLNLPAPDYSARGRGPAGGAGGRPASAEPGGRRGAITHARAHTANNAHAPARARGNLKNARESTQIEKPK